MSILKPLKAWKHLAKKPHTIRYPHEEHVDMEGKKLPVDTLRGFHTNDLDKCIGCGLCGKICMNEAITYEKIPELKEKGLKGINIRPVIDYGRCCFCGLCTEICPTKSLKLTPNFKLISTDKKDYKFMPTQLVEKNDDFAVDLDKVLFSPDDYSKKFNEEEKDNAKEA